MNKTLAHLIARLASLIAAATDTLAANPSQVDAWHDEMARLLRRYTLAAYVSGNGSADHVPREVVDGLTSAQLDFLRAFKDDIQAAPEWKPAFAARAQMYAESIKAPWWAAKTRAWPLPALPGDGTTQCLTRCGCAWEIDELDGDGNANAYWRRAKDDSCQTCIERERQWSPLRIRDGAVQ